MYKYNKFAIIDLSQEGNTLVLFKRREKLDREKDLHISVANVDMKLSVFKTTALPV